MRHFIPGLLIAASGLLMVACTDGKPGDDTDVTDTDTVVDDTDTVVEDTDVTDTDVTDTDALCYTEGVSGECWDCDLPAAPESDSLKALNQCTDSTYVAFDNAARIPAATWTPGTPLPAVP